MCCPYPPHPNPWSRLLAIFRSLILSNYFFALLHSFFRVLARITRLCIIVDANCFVLILNAWLSLQSRATLDVILRSKLHFPFCPMWFAERIMLNSHGNAFLWAIHERLHRFRNRYPPADEFVQSKERKVGDFEENGTIDETNDSVRNRERGKKLHNANNCRSRHVCANKRKRMVVDSTSLRIPKRVRVDSACAQDQFESATQGITPIDGSRCNIVETKSMVHAEHMSTHLALQLLGRWKELTELTDLTVSEKLACLALLSIRYPDVGRVTLEFCSASTEPES